MDLQPLSYHQEVASYLEKHERGLWDWFSSDDYSKKYAQGVKLELLKATYRLQPDEHQAVYDLAKQAMKVLEIDLPLTIYQAESASSNTNAALYYMKDEIVILLMGAITDLLDEKELLALLGHELSHHKLYFAGDERFFTTSRLLDWCTDQENCHGAYLETDRLYGLYTEVYADLGALKVTRDRDAVISCLVKIATGMKKVSPAAYLQQADEVLEQIKKGSEGISHPETFIRAKVLEQIAANPADMQSINKYIEGELDAKLLDLPGQFSLSLLTYSLIDAYGARDFVRTEPVIAHARRYFPEFEWKELPTTGAQADALAKQVGRAIKPLSGSAANYLSYVLLDMATCDPDGDDPALAWSLLLADKIGIFKTFEPIARKEMKRKKADLLKLAAEAESKMGNATSVG